MNKPIGRLLVITDTNVQQRYTHEQLAALAVEGGAEIIQFRDKSCSTAQLIELASVLRDICHRSGVPLIINDRTDVALAVDADGVHLGQQDLPIPVARRILGPGKIIGGTAATREQAKLTEAEGADYIGFGHIYPTSSKVKPTPPKGPESLRQICEAVEIPVIAIGGINAANLPPVFDAGAWGVAVIGSVCAASDPFLASREIKDAILEQIQKR